MRSRRKMMGLSMPHNADTICWCFIVSQDINTIFWWFSVSLDINAICWCFIVSQDTNAICQDFSVSQDADIIWWLYNATWVLWNLMPYNDIV